MSNIVKFALFIVGGILALTVLIKVVKAVFSLIFGLLLPILFLAAVLYVVYLLFGGKSKPSGAPRGY